MSESHTGGCRCGQIRYRCDAAPTGASLCHCRDCQYASGGPFSALAFFPRASLHLQGELRHYDVKGSAGLTVQRYFCPTCGTPIMSALAELPDLAIMKIGSLDQPSAIPPAVHIWCDSMLSWVKMDDGLPRLPGNPPL